MRVPKKALLSLFLSNFHSRFTSRLMRLVNTRRMQTLVMRKHIGFTRFSSLRNVPFRVKTRRVNVRIVTTHFRNRVRDVHGRLSINNIVNLRTSRGGELLRGLRPQVFLLSRKFFLQFLEKELHRFQFLILPFSNNFLDDRTFHLGANFFLHLLTHPFLHLPTHHLRFHNFPHAHHFHFHLLSNHRLDNDDLALGKGPIMDRPSNNGDRRRSGDRGGSTKEKFFVLKGAKAREVSEVRKSTT